MVWPSGKICFDKSNQLISYFLEAIKIVHDHCGRVQRMWAFDAEMAAFCGNVTPQNPNGTENRAWYNKSLFPRYYGFLDVEHTTNEATSDYLLSTPRGESLLRLAEYHADVNDPKNEHSFYIPRESRFEAYQLFADAIRFGSFGRHNTGAEQSESDIDPPSVMLRIIYELKEASKEEICYGIYALHRQEKHEIEDVIAQIKYNRGLRGFSYKQILESWKLKNIVYDFKLAKILADPGLGFLEVRHDANNHTDRFNISRDVPDDIVRYIAQADGIYHPMKWLISVNSTFSLFREWVRNVVAGGVHNDDFVISADLTQGSPMSWKVGFTRALLTAFKNPQRNVYFSTFASSEIQLRDSLGSCVELLDRVDDVKDEYNGWSKNTMTDPASYRNIIQQCNKFRGPDGGKLSQILPVNEIKLPANFHFVGGIVNV